MYCPVMTKLLRELITRIPGRLGITSIEPRGFITKPQLGLALEIISLSIIDFWPHCPAHATHRPFLRLRLDAFQEFCRRLPVLEDQRFLVEFRSENFRSIIQQPGFLGASPDRRRGAHARYFLFALEPGANPPNEASQIRSLGTVECMQFINDEKPQFAALVVLPERLV